MGDVLARTMSAGPEAVFVFDVANGESLYVSAVTAQAILGVPTETAHGSVLSWPGLSASVVQSVLAFIVSPVAWMETLVSASPSERDAWKILIAADILQVPSLLVFMATYVATEIGDERLRAFLASSFLIDLSVDALIELQDILYTPHNACIWDILHAAKISSIQAHASRVLHAKAAATPPPSFSLSNSSRQRIPVRTPHRPSSPARLPTPPPGSIQ